MKPVTFEITVRPHGQKVVIQFEPHDLGLSAHLTSSPEHEGDILTEDDMEAIRDVLAGAVGRHLGYEVG